MAELLLSKGYEVHGIKRRASSSNTARVDHLYSDPHEKDVRFHLHYGDLTDTDGLGTLRLLEAIRIQTRPDEKNSPSQRKHIDICALPSYERRPLILHNHYGVRS